MPAAGFVTEEIRQDGRRVGFDVVSLTGDRAPLARVGGGGGGPGGGGGSRRPTVGQYSVDVASFERVALPTLASPSDRGGRLVVLDEIGKMELFSTKFQRAVRVAFDGGLTVVATIPVPRGATQTGLLAELRARKDAHLLHVTPQNRDGAVAEVVQFVRESLQRSGAAGEPGRH